MVTASHRHRMVHQLDHIYRQPDRICLRLRPVHTVLHRSVVAAVVSRPVDTAVSVSRWAVVMAVDSLQAAASVVGTEDTLRVDSLRAAVMVVASHPVADMVVSPRVVAVDTMP